MTDEECKTRADELREMYNIFRSLKDRGERKTFQRIIRKETIELTKI